MKALASDLGQYNSLLAHVISPLTKVSSRHWLRTIGHRSNPLKQTQPDQVVLGWWYFVKDGEIAPARVRLNS